MYVRIIKAFEFRNDRGEKVTAPRGWLGDLSDKHGKAALASGHAVQGDPRALPMSETSTARPGPSSTPWRPSAALTCPRPRPRTT
jgi:hypothetical protein